MTDESAQTWWEELYDALLPRGVAVLPGVELAATCLVPEAGDARRGDWFDSFPHSEMDAQPWSSAMFRARGWRPRSR